MNTKQQKFITLRADGLSFDKICDELKIAKSTAIQWAKYFEAEIKDLQFNAFVKIKEAYSFNLQKRYEALLKELNKVEVGILQADLSNVQLKDLYSIKNDILNRLDMIEKRVKTDPKITYKNELGFEDRMEFKLNEA